MARNTGNPIVQEDTRFSVGIEDELSLAKFDVLTGTEME
jgi:hypothetical protein